MSNYTVDCKKYKKDGEEKDLNDYKVEISNEETHLSFLIECDNEEDNDSYKLDYLNERNFIVEKDRCNVNIYVKRNRLPYDRTFSFTCTHSNNEDASIEIEITQKGEEYKLEINERHKEITFFSIPEEGKEEYSIPITVTGGSCKYRIASIVKFHVEEEETNTDSEEIIETSEEEGGNVTYQPFDNGFVYYKTAEGLNIINYGRPFLEEEDYYVITLRHENYRECTEKITIKYDILTEDTEEQEETDSTEVQTQISDLYKLREVGYTNHSHSNERENDYNLELLDISDNLLEIENVDEREIGFEVDEDFMIGVKTTCVWCNTTIDNDNRKIKFRITNVPLRERSCYVTVRIVDYPEINKTFKLVNKVS